MTSNNYQEKGYDQLKNYRLLPEPKGELENLIEGGKENGNK